MRDLFLSEQRYLRNTILRNLGRDLRQIGPVLSEYYAPPRRGPQHPHFNTDFVLRFVEQGSMPEHRSFCSRVMPNTMGAEVFVTVDAKTGQPLMTELDSGEAFSLKDFNPYIETIEFELTHLNLPLQFKATSYCRVFVIENDICFLAFPDDDVPVQRGNRNVLRDDAESSIISYATEGKLVCVDGWIKTDVAESEWHLVAEPVDED